MSSRIAALLVFALPSGLLAQNTFLVGPGTAYPQIADAVNVANPGDVIVVRPGAYTVFLLTKGLTIRAEVPGTVSVSAAIPIQVHAPAGQTATLIGLRLATLGVIGSAVLDHCWIDGPHGYLSISLGMVTMQSCVIAPPAVPWVPIQTALVANGSQISAIDCTIVGHDAIVAQSTSAEAAIDLTGTSFRGSFLTVRGGFGGASLGVVPAIRADAASQVWISDSTITADGVCPVVATNARFDRCVVTPACGAVQTGFVLGLHQPQPLVTGNVFDLEFRAGPNMPVGVWAGGTVAVTAVPVLEQSLLLDAGTCYPVALIVADGVGLAVASWPIPAAPSLVDHAFWFQGIGGIDLPLQVSPLGGGVLR